MAPDRFRLFLLRDFTLFLTVEWSCVERLARITSPSFCLLNFYRDKSYFWNPYSKQTTSMSVLIRPCAVN